MPRALVCVALGLALTACGSSDDELGAPPRYRIPGCEAYDTAPCNVLDKNCQTRLMNIAACLRGEAAAPLPSVSIMTEDEYADDLRMQLAAADPVPDSQEFETVFTWLNLVVPGAFEPENAIAEHVADVAGFYRPEDKTIVIIDHGQNTNVETASDTLVHEFVHALQDREVDLTAFADAYPSYYDTDLAVNAIVEGEARFHETRYRAPMLGLDPRRVDWPATFEKGVVESEAWTLKQQSPLVAAREAFPYAWGARYLSFDWDTTGHDGVLALLQAPPTATHALIASTSAVVTDGFIPTEFEPPVEPAGWTRLGDEKLGAFGTFLLFGRLDQMDAEALALDWRGDRLFVETGVAPSGATGTVAVWYADFASAIAASDVSNRLNAMGFLQVVRGTRLIAAKSARGDIDLSWVFATD